MGILIGVMVDNQAHRVLRQHVQTDALLGVDTVVLDQTASMPANSDGQSQMFQRLDPQAKHQILQTMDETEVRSCTKCPLCEGRTQTVFGEGDPNAQLMFIGEGPGKREDELGRPFVGRAGELLDKQIAAMKLTREQVFIANIVKCRPPGNRTPSPDEIQACSDYLCSQIRTVQPRVIVTLGAAATKSLLQTREGITRIRGTWHEYLGLTPDGPTIPAMPTFHPAYLLRVYTPDNRRKVWDDLQKVVSRLTEPDNRSFSA